VAPAMAARATPPRRAVRVDRATLCLGTRPRRGGGKGGTLPPRAHRRDSEGEGSRARQQWPRAPRRRIGPRALATTRHATGLARAGVWEGRDTAGLLLRCHVAHVAAAACKELARRGRAAAAAGDGRPRHGTAQGHVRQPRDAMPQGPPVWEWRHRREAAELCLCHCLTHVAALGGNERRRGREREEGERG